eukprot:m.20486 g.20486  ORF g.20486 m.20486 type:complete len:391 (-) comp7854_c0_seq1:315-1487(-)
MSCRVRINQFSSMAAQQEKRPLSPGEEGSEDRRKFATVASGNPLTMRCLMSFKQAGTVIGKGGATVAKLRQDTGCRITISENLGMDQDRVLEATGDQEAVAKVFSTICTALGEAMHQRPTTQASPDQQQLFIRIPIPNSHAGVVIGKQGSRIEEIRRASGAQVMVEKTPLPGSTERLCTVSGVPESVRAAVAQIVTVISMASQRADQNVPFQPGMSPSFGVVPSHIASVPPHHLPHMHPLHHYPHPPHHLHPHQASSPSPAFALPPSPYPPMQSELMPVPTQTLYVPSEHAGALIGKGGSNIQHIRQTTGALIKVSPSMPGEHQRTVTISGSFEACQFAARLIDMKLAEATLALDGRPAAHHGGPILPHSHALHHGSHSGHPLGPLGMHH